MKKRAEGKNSLPLALFPFYLLLPLFILHNSSFALHPLLFGVARSQKMICVPFTVDVTLYISAATSANASIFGIG